MSINIHWLIALVFAVLLGVVAFMVIVNVGGEGVQGQSSDLISFLDQVKMLIDC